MEQKEKDRILDKMVQISQQKDKDLNQSQEQTRGNITYYNDFEFGKSGLAVKNVYIVEIQREEQNETGDKKGRNRTTYEIYDEAGELIATVTEEGKVQFTRRIFRTITKHR